MKMGELNVESARAKLNSWWSTRSKDLISMTNTQLVNQPTPRSAVDMGVSLDIEATMSRMPVSGPFTLLMQRVGLQSFASIEVQPVLKIDNRIVRDLEKFVADNHIEDTDAKATYVGSSIRLQPEGATVTLDATKLHTAILDAFKSGTETELPLKIAKKHVSDEDLAKITTVISTFKTNFDSGNRNRSNNIKVASAKINGTVLLPGEQFSFNETVGRRTPKNGFKEAGVFKDGKHDRDFGGGICQVSTTLFNASLFADLKIAERQNHSMPVPYVPIGRDATVDYGAIDLKIVNNFDFPIALSASYEPGRLTFRILGNKKLDYEVKVESETHRSWAPKQQVVIDYSIPAGTERVREHGSSGRTASAYRYRYQDGERVGKTETFESYYRGGLRVVARNPNKPAPKVAKSPTPSASSTPVTNEEPTIPETVPPIDNSKSGVGN